MMVIKFPGLFSLHKLGLCISLFSLLCAVTPLRAQDSTRLINQRSAGILVEYASPYYYLPEGFRYYALPTGAMVSFPLFKARRFFNMSVEIYPHYSFVWVEPSEGNYEVGVNIRLAGNFSLSPNDVISAKLATGPHYFTVETEKQAEGFLFSDYYLLTYNRRFFIRDIPFSMLLETGYRHMSNAGLQMPNRSVSNFIFGLGVLYAW